MSNRNQIIDTMSLYLETAQKNKHKLNIELLLDKPGWCRRTPRHHGNN